MNTSSNIRFAFFGSSRFSVIVLDEFERSGYVPDLIVTSPDKPRGRHMEVSPSPVKEWALARKIEVFDPEKLDEEALKELGSPTLKKLAAKSSMSKRNPGWDVFIVASYGKIIPESIINIPLHKTLNIHPSLLPKYRGPSPIQSAILSDDKKTGVTIMRINKEMDHGPIVAQEEVMVKEWPRYEELEELMAKKGAVLLARILPDWISGRIEEKPQNHSQATYAKKINKKDALLNMSDDPYLNFRKIQAYHEWPQAYFFIEFNGKKLRVKVTDASFHDGALLINKVIPEGAKEMPYDDFKRGYKIG